MVGQARQGKGEEAALFYVNRECPSFPCHPSVPEDEHNCKFCYCPLYALAADCPGNFTLTERGYKDCSGCVLPHEGIEGARRVLDSLPMVLSQCRDAISAQNA